MMRLASLRSVLLLHLSVVAASVVGVNQQAWGQQAGVAGEPSTVRAGERELPDEMTEVLWWLPEETEAVVVSRGNVPIRRLEPRANTGRLTWTPQPRSGNELPAQSHDLTPAPQLAAPHKYACEDLLAEMHSSTLTRFHEDVYRQNEMIRSFFGGKTASLFVSAVWWDNDTTRETCSIVTFRDGTASQIIGTLADFPHVPRSIGGVYVVEVDFNRDRNSEFPNAGGIPFDLNDLRTPTRKNLGYFAAPRPNVYVVTTSSAFLRVIIDRMKERGARRALPPSLPEWQHVDTSSPAWGLRHYRSAIAGKDSLTMAGRDPGAEGLVFFCGNLPTQFICLRYISSSIDASDMFLQMQANWQRRDIRTMVPMRRVNAECVEARVRINVSNTEAKSDRRSLSVAATTYCLPGTYLPLMGFSCPELTARRNR